MTGRAYALSDGNSFYCSCERVFDARLARVPVIVLINNDGFCNRAFAVKGCRATSVSEGPHRVESGATAFYRKKLQADINIVCSAGSRRPLVRPGTPARIVR